jgi:purine-binding chemotaxis protein CheW
MQYLFFELETEKYALEAKNVGEVVDHTVIRTVPHTNSAIKGVTNIRGELVGVIDLKSRLCIENSGNAKRNSFIIVQLELGKEKVNMALLVDMVIEVDIIQDDAVLSSPDFGTKIDQKFIRNILQYNDEYISVLNLETVLDFNELSKKEG